MYTGFAAAYDELMDDLDYPSRAEMYLDMIERAGGQPGEICDCATGTGKMAVEFARRGCAVSGSDISEDMLRRAVKNAADAGVRVPFHRQDMRSFELPHPCGTVTACCDGVNYLLTLRDVSRFFSSAQRALKPGGVLAFDISSAYKLEHVLGDRFYGEDRPGVSYLWQNSWDERTRTVSMDMTFFLKRGDGLYERVDECHRQRAHAREEIASLLRGAGFEDVRAYGEDAKSDPKDKDLRLYFTARKPSPGGAGALCEKGSSV